jgi:FtsZ-interacting cell division protein ZipA
MAKARKKAAKKASKKTSKKSRTPAQKRATAELVKRNKAKKSGKKAGKKRASAKRAAEAVPRKRRATNKAAAGAVSKARKRRAPKWTKIQVEHHAREDEGTFYGPMPRKAARKARKYSSRGLMSHYDLAQSYHKASAAHPNRVHVAKPKKKAAKKKAQRVVTANDILKNVRRKSSKLAVWQCASLSGRRTGCGGGKRGGHVVGVLR